MQNRGTIGIFTVLLILSALYILSFSYFTNKFEAKASTVAEEQFAEQNPDSDPKEFKEEIEALKRTYLRENGDEEVYPVFGNTYNELKESELNLGLDLQGGMSVTLEVSVPDLLMSWSDNNTSVPEFAESVTEARQAQKSSGDDFITLFEDAWSSKGASTPLWRILNNYEVQDKFSKNVDDATIIDEIRNEVEEAVNNTENIIRKRIDQFGVAQPNVQQEQTTKRIIVELPGVKDKERIRKKIGSVANLQFWDTYFAGEISADFARADEALGKELFPEVYLEDDNSDSDDDGVSDVIENAIDSTDVADINPVDTTDNGIDLSGVDTSSTSGLNLDDASEETVTDEVDEAAIEKNRKMNPVRSRITSLGGGSAIGSFKLTDTADVNYYLNHPVFKSNLPNNLRLLWDSKTEKLTNQETEEETEVVFLYAIKTIEGSNKPPVDGSTIVNARADLNPNTNKPELNMQMNSAGSTAWADMTTKASADNQRQIAIVLDDMVLSAPNSTEPITDGSTRITFGNKTGTAALKEAQDLAGLLEAGSLPAPAKIVNENTVGPTIGQQNIDAGKMSFIIALLVILVYMIFYYKGAGLISNIALIVNMIILIGALISVGATLTLPGIAGIVLTIGMAVDANVLIYERIREELRHGKGLSQAVKDGYKAAYSAIIDANVTTMLTALILVSFGSGPIKGFATTLIIGILTSLFSAIIITRLIIYGRLEKKKAVSFSTDITKNWFTNMNFQFVKRRRTFYVVSGIIILAGIVGLFTRGLDRGVDFAGGRTYEMHFNEQLSHDQVSDALKGAFTDTEGNDVNSKVQTVGSTGIVYKITTQYMIDSEDLEADSKVRTSLYSAFTNAGFTFDEDNVSFNKVDPSISDDFRRGAIIATVLSLIVIFLYIFFRFRKMQYSVGALLAMVHDVLIVLGLFALLRGIVPFSLEIDQAFIAAILTVIGYSINDTVVVFDRIREYLGLRKNKDRKTVINDALNSTLSRTINTSLSTFIVLLMIFLFGGDEIKGFTFALMIGVIVGTYSSLFIATPAVIDLSKDEDHIL